MILASNSPRRREILEGFGFDIKVDVLEVEEKSEHTDPVEFVKEIARAKGVEVAKANPKELVVSADTIVVLDNEILGKPKSESDAIETLKRLSNRKHRVITSFALFHIDKQVEQLVVEETEVEIKELTDDEIKWYVDTKDPLDKAGSYGIQGLGNILVKGINGDFFNVMGFPLSTFYDTLKELGYRLDQLKEL